MNYLYSWLKEFYPALPPLNQLEPLLIQIGHDVESITPVDYDGVIVAEIKAVSKHPNADKLSLATVTDGTQNHEIVCGAPNLFVGQKVAYAPVGTTLPSGMAIRPVKIRGIDSDGMLCAEDELGIGPHHAELLPVPAEAENGAAIAKYCPPDAVFALDITPNRGDVLSHFGLARDCKAAIEHEVLSLPALQPYEAKAPAKSELVINGLDEAATSFNLAEVKSESPQPATPLYMQARLLLLGQKSINLATDITNYVLLAYGQPLHAYDADRLVSSSHFGVRRAQEHESFIGLNNKTYTLNNETLVVTNNNQPVSIAGIIGGQDTSTNKNTQRVIFESALFQAKTIAITARRLSLMTDSATRFSRGVDPNLSQFVLGFAIQLWQEATGGIVVSTASKTKDQHAVPALTLSLANLQRFLGIECSYNEVAAILTGLGCTINRLQNSNSFEATPPSWRFDLHQSQDYAEEIARIIGLQNLPKRPLLATIPYPKRGRYWRIEQLKDILASLGGYEIFTYPFISEQEMMLWQFAPPLPQLTLAPIEDKVYMRPSLKPTLAGALAANPDIPHSIFFEVAKTFQYDKESLNIGIGIATTNQTEADNFWRNLFERLKLPVASWMSRVSSLPDELKEAYKIRKPYTYLLELPVEEFIHLKLFETPVPSIPDLDKIHYTPLGRYQASRRDVAFIINTDYEEMDVTKSLKQIDPAIVSVELFDTYKNSSLGVNNYSLAYRIYYQSPNKTLTNDEIQTIHQKVEDYIKEHYHGTIR